MNPVDTQRVETLIDNLVITCEYERHNIASVREYLLAIKARLDEGTEPTLDELNLLFRIDDFATNKGESVLKAVNINAIKA